MTGIVERLRFCENYEWSPLMHEAAAELERLRAAYDSRGGEMDSMRMVLAQTQKWNEDRLAELARLRALLGALVSAVANNETSDTVLRSCAYAEAQRAFLKGSKQ